jgi:hypothetical protein
MWPNLTIDLVTMTLLLIAVLPWLAPLFKSVELPGGVKVQFQDLQNAEESIAKAGLLAPAKPQDKDAVYSFQLVADKDPNLALAGLRIEIEKVLSEIAEPLGLKSHRYSIRGLLRELSERQVLTQQERSVLENLLELLNHAVHGGEITREAAGWAMDVGPRLLEGLKERFKK